MPGPCPACQHPFTAQDVAAYGILHARHADKGGPWIGYRCLGCNRVIHLIPHGEGRYARPGEPPPPRPSQPPQAPWRQAGAGGGGPPGSPPGRAPRDAPAAGTRAPTDPPPHRRHGGPRQQARDRPGRGTGAGPPPPARDEATGPDELSLAAARELLGTEAHASVEAIDQAFRSLSRLCHPDKVAHLDADFQRLAQTKFLRLRAAHAQARDAAPDELGPDQ